MYSRKSVSLLGIICGGLLGPAQRLQLCLALALGLVVPACASEKKIGKHLFILSGQSNMTGTVKDAFAARVAERFGKGNAVVVIRMKSGRGIRFWVADYHQPVGRGLTEKKMGSNGQEYKPLIETALAAAKDQAFDTDDLNGGDADKSDGDIHFPKEGAASLGQRFADKALELIDR